MKVEEYHSYTNEHAELMKFIRGISHDVEEIVVNTHRSRGRLSARFVNTSRCAWLDATHKVKEFDPEYVTIMNWPISRVEVFVNMEDCIISFTSIENGKCFINYNSLKGDHYTQSQGNVDISTIDFGEILKCAGRNAELGCPFYNIGEPMFRVAKSIHDDVDYDGKLIIS